MTDIRDTKFAGFAELLFRDLSRLGLVALVDVGNFADNLDRAMELQDEMNQLTKQIFTQRVYDLVQHTIESLWPYINADAVEPTPADIPDLTQWPDLPGSE